MEAREGQPPGHAHFGGEEPTEDRGDEKGQQEESHGRNGRVGSEKGGCVTFEGEQFVPQHKESANGFRTREISSVSEWREGDTDDRSYCSRIGLSSHKIQRETSYE